MEDPRLLHRRVGSLRAAPEGERDHPREPAHLLFRQLVLGMVRQAGVVHALDLGMVLQELGDGEGVLFVLAHADGESLEAAEHDPGVEGAWYGAGGVLVELDPLLELLVRGRDSPPTTSEWPPMYLVVEWTTMSAPRASGFWKYGEAKVLSTATNGSRSCAISESSAMSERVSIGLVGVSIQRNLVSGLSASSTAAASVVSA